MKHFCSVETNREHNCYWCLWFQSIFEDPTWTCLPAISAFHTWKSDMCLVFTKSWPKKCSFGEWDWFNWLESWMGCPRMQKSSRPESNKNAAECWFTPQVAVKTCGTSFFPHLLPSFWNLFLWWRFNPPLKSLCTFATLARKNAKCAFHRSFTFCRLQRSGSNFLLPASFDRAKWSLTSREMDLDGPETSTHCGWSQAITSETCFWFA